MRIHKEGHRILIKTFAIGGAVVYGSYMYLGTMPILQYLFYAAPAVVFFLFLQFFRVPSRVRTTGDNLVMAPADGKVVVIEDTEETEYFKGKRKQISIFMSPTNVHQNLNPIGGVVKYFKYHPGKYLVAWHPKSSTENERTTCVIKNEQGVEILFRQIAGAVARRICWYIKENDQVKQCEEMGFIKFGSRVDVFLPLDAEIKVNIDDISKGGQTVLAELK
jgi:phosphatidylserine decarboxylase